MYTVVLDTNVLLSALLFPAHAPGIVYDRVKQGAIRLYISDFILEEMKRVLVEKFKLDASVVELHLRRLRTVSVVISPRKYLRVIKTRADDNRILECALEARADFLVTGDKKHILPLGKIGDTRILSPAEFLKICKVK